MIRWITFILVGTGVIGYLQSESIADPPAATVQDDMLKYLDAIQPDLNVDEPGHLDFRRGWGWRSIRSVGRG